MKKFAKTRARLRSLLLILVLATGQVATATGPFISRQPVYATNDKIRICHRSASYTNPYQDIEVDTNAADGLAGNSGNNPDHFGEHKGPIFYPQIPKHTEWGDIIPPIAGVHTGLNWTAEGQMVWNNRCNFRDGDLEVNKKVDANGDGFYEGGNPTANTLGFKWGYNGDTPAYSMGDDQDDLPIGDYAVNENTLPGYTFKGWYYTAQEDNIGGTQVNCAHPQGTTLPVPVEVKNNQKTAVTFCNQKTIIAKSTVTIVKDAVPNDVQDFAFNIQRTDVGGGSNFILDDDGNENNDRKSSEQFLNNVDPGEYKVTETAVDGWALTSASCSGTGLVTQALVGQALTFTILPGSNVTCTFTNTKKQGSVRVAKQVDEGLGYAYVGAESPFKWGLDNGAVNKDMGTKVNNVDVGAHTVTENIASQSDYELAGWYIGDGSCTNAQNLKTLPVPLNVQYDLTTTVTFCNKVKEDKKITLCHATGSLQNPFVVINISKAGAFHGHLDDGSGGIHGDHQNGEDIIPPFEFNGQTYSQNWVNNPNGQATFRNGCVPPTDGKISGYKFHDLNQNGTKQLLEPKIGNWKITLKDSQNNVVQTTYTNNNIFSAQYGNYSFNNLAYGTYFVCEERPFGWLMTTPNIDENGCIQVVVGANQKNIVMNFGNLAQATITVYKNVDENGDGDTTDEGETNSDAWTWDYLSLLDSEFNVTTGTTETIRTGLAGTFYLLSEDQQDGYDLVDVDCNEGFLRIGDSVKVFATVGEEIECTFTNKKRAEVVIHKIANPADGTDFTFTLSKTDPNQNDDLDFFKHNFNDNDWFHADKTFILDDAEEDDGDQYSDSEALSLKTDKTYYITEESLDGWDLESIYCYAGDNLLEVNRTENTLELYLPDSSDTINCYFVNEKRGEVVVTKYNDLNRNGEQDEEEPTLEGWDITLDEHYKYKETQTTDENGTTTFEAVKPGWYHLSETMQDGWNFSDLDCDNQEWEEVSRQVNLVDEVIVDDQEELSEDGEWIRVPHGQTVTCAIGNYHDVVLSLTKSNNRPNVTVTGDTVTYTLVASLDEESGVLYNTTITDLAPEGFVYVPGSATSTKGSLTKTYASPGVWTIGTMYPGEVVTMTYQAKIASSVSNGTYPDVAFAVGCALDGQEVCPDGSEESTDEMRYSNVRQDGNDDPFVNTKVTVATPQVLGASTLVETGSKHTLVYAITALVLMLIGVATTSRRNPLKGGAK